MMHIFEIDVNNCRFCWQTSLARVLANPSLPIGKKMINLDFHLGDPRIAKITQQKGGIYLPLIRGFDKVGGKHIPKFDVISVLDFIHMKTFLKEMHNIL